LNDLTRPQAEVNATVGLRQTLVAREQLENQIQQQVRDAARDADTRWRQLEIAHRARELADQKVEIEREKLQAGRSSNFQVLTYENDLQAAETNELTASLLYLNALTNLDQQVGTTLDTWKISLNDDH
jgi:outer membrane protein TolC